MNWTDYYRSEAWQERAVERNSPAARAFRRLCEYYNFNPNQIVKRDKRRFLMIYRWTMSERLNAPTATAQTIAESINEDLPGVHVTKAWDDNGISYILVREDPDFADELLRHAWSE